MRDIQVFLEFVYFYGCFIQGFNKIIKLLSSMLKINNSSKNSLKKVVENNELVGRTNNSGQKLAHSKKSKIHQNLVKSQKSKNHQILATSKKSNPYSKLSKSEILVNFTVITNGGATGYLTTKTRVVFICLRQLLTNASIL